MMLGPAEIIIIVASVGIFFFGGKKVKEWARDIGQAKGEFEEAKKEVAKKKK